MIRVPVLTGRQTMAWTVPLNTESIVSEQRKGSL